MQEGGLGDYLTLLSVSQTCKYRGVSFLQFLLSKECDLEVYARRPRRRPPFALELYPEGYVPPQLAYRQRMRLQRQAKDIQGLSDEESEGEHSEAP
jgi:hypothetical protein